MRPGVAALIGKLACARLLVLPRDANGKTYSVSIQPEIEGRQNSDCEHSLDSSCLSTLMRPGVAALLGRRAEARMFSVYRVTRTATFVTIF